MISYRHNPVNSVAISPDGKMIASTADQRTYLWDLTANKLVNMLTDPDNQFLNSVRFSPGGESLVTGGRGVRVWDLSSGKNTLRSRDNSYLESRDKLNLDETTAVYSPNGKTIAVGTSRGATADGNVQIWDAANLTLLGSLGGYSKRVFSLTFSPDGKLLATGSEGMIKLWDLSVPSEMFSFPRQSGVVTSVAFSPDGKTFASGVEDGTISLWDVATGKELKTWKLPNVSVEEIVFSPDGKYLVSGGSDGLIRVWDPLTGNLVRRIPAQSGLVLQ